MRLLTELGPRLGFSVTIIPEVVVGERRRQLDANPPAARGGRRRGGRRAARARLLACGAGWGRATSAGARSGSRPRTSSPRTRCCRRRRLRRAAALPRRRRPAARRRRCPAVTNVGTRPTFGARTRVVVEAHLIDFSGDLYGRRVELSFRFHLRPERRFAGVDALRAQIDADRDEARRRLAAG